MSCDQDLAEPPVLACVPCAYSLAEYSEEATAPDVSLAHSFAEPAGTVVPTAYSLEEYSEVSTVLPVVIDHSLAEPFEAVFVTPVPPTAQAFEE